MANRDEIRMLGNCCPCCGGPIVPSRASLRRDKVGARSLNFIEGEAIRNRGEWNLQMGVEPKLMDRMENLHLFPKTNVIPPMHALFTGVLNDVFGDDPSHHQAHHYFPADGNNATADANLNNPVPAGYFIVGNAPRRRRVPVAAGAAGPLPHPAPTVEITRAVVMWEEVVPIPGFQVLNDLIRDCVVRTGNREVAQPRLDLTVPGCKSCNDIMTQESTSSHFLVRHDITLGGQLIPDDSIFRQEVYMGPANTNRFDGHYRWDPSDATRDKKKGFFSYEACLAYYIHRCLPDRPILNLNRARIVRRFSIVFSVTLLLVMCLIFERYNGCEGGKSPRRKHVYRYRGVVELYLTYIFWTLVCNDNPQGEANGFNQQRCNMGFTKFHRYLFSELLEAIVLSGPQFAGAYEFTDILFGPYEPGPPEEILGHYCRCIVDFYTNHLKPMFSRHFARMDPDRRLEHGPAADVGLFTRQVLAYNMLVSPDTLNMIMHFLERATDGDIDTFIDSVGVHSILACWNRLVQMCPAKTSELVNDFTDALVKREYSHIMVFMRSNPEQPRVSPQTAETVYLLCNALYPPTEPDNEEELALLRIAPKCSPHNAVARLNMVGAFKEDEEQAV